MGFVSVFFCSAEVKGSFELRSQDDKGEMTRAR